MEAWEHAGREAQERARRLPLPRRSRAFALVSLLLVCAGCRGGPAVQAQPLERYAFSHPQMGTLFNVVLYAPDSVLARAAADAAFRRIDTLNQHLSDYLAESELSRLSATAGSGRAVPVSDPLWTVLVAAQDVAARTGGAFDVTIGPLTRLWRRAVRRQTLPPADALEEARPAVGYQHVHLDSTVQAVRLDRPGMRLDLGGIAKGYAVDEALRVLRGFGITAALVDGGGDLAVGAPPPGESGWRIETSTVRGDTLVPEVRLLARGAVATSGDTYRYVEAGGVRYAHIIDPRTGLGVTHSSRVTVVAPTGMQADALASACSVLPPGEALALAARLEGVALRLLLRTEAGYGLRQSPAFDILATAAPATF